MSSLTNRHSLHGKRDILIIALLSISALLSIGCALSLFEYPLNREELALVKEKAPDPKLSELAGSLSRRPDFRLTVKKDKSGGTRLIFRDLQDFIDNEWLEGRGYLKTMPLTLYSSDISGMTGLLVRKENLAHYELKEEITSGRRTTPGITLSFIHIGSVYNGFDRQGHSFSGGGRLRERRNKPCRKCPGYYHFEAKKPQGDDPGILIVVLDTSTKNFKLAKGTVYRHKEMDPPDESRKREQIEWLESVLEEDADRGNWMVLAFGHQALNAANFSDKSWKKVAALFNSPKYNVVAYFCGHSHNHWIHPPENKDYPGTFGFWQIMTDSIMEYPKRGSLVNIAYTEKGAWEITIQSFWPYFLDNLPGNAPVLLRNAKKSYEASKIDKAGKKKLARYRDLQLKHHDVVLRFPYPKAK